MILFHHNPDLLSSHIASYRSIADLEISTTYPGDELANVLRLIYDQG
jgi:hypothetical protein